MDAITPTRSELGGGTSEPSALQGTPSRLGRDQDWSSSVFAGLAGLLATLLVIAVLCVLWNWTARKTRRVPYLRVTTAPLLTLPPSRQRAKNIYDLVPRRQGVLGRHQSRSFRVFSIESLLSRNADSPPSAHVVHSAQAHSVGIYDNARGPWVYENLTPSAHSVHVRAAGDDLSVSSEDSRDYVNVPTAAEIAELLASPSHPPGNLFARPSARELESTEERDKGWDHASDYARFLPPGTEGNDPLSDEESSSQTSNDYVNTAELGLGAAQGEQPWMSFQCCPDYENVPPAGPNGSQQLAEGVTSSHTNRVEGRTEGTETHGPLVMPSGRFLVSGDYGTYQPSAQSESRQMNRGGEGSNQDSGDDDIVLAAALGGNAEQEEDTWPFLWN
ncbi:lymphocyte transmembrane adapter 1 isoform X2 [Myotis daubentonii]|uniref:lymphocyte transmembrane adapter 1 isoform X2 n=1 Tax=Myotis daubentonii TaxID=98922 RepID=UPI00287324F3|nr:lymphocyte transmembrane adapter 1 isoform X2 [Myotis daubentonii]